MSEEARTINRPGRTSRVHEGGGLGRVFLVGKVIQTHEVSIHLVR